MADREGEYFNAALSDFVFDVAAGGAIRHLTDRGYSVEQIIGKLDYPVPRSKVEQAVYSHLLGSGILLSSLPAEDAVVRMCLLQPYKDDIGSFAETLVGHIEKFGEKNSYMECPFGIWISDDEERLRKSFELLSSREREYILGINWKHGIMYHRLNDRMREIGTKLAGHDGYEWKFFFLSYGD